MRFGRFPPKIVLPVMILALYGASGCSHSSQYNPYAQPGAGNPWLTPNAAMAPGAALPPPLGQAPIPPATPALPTAPPPQGMVVPNMATPVPSPGIQRPNWNNPGTLTQQRQQANVFDPFANNEVGPEIVGGRPRDFQKPISEAVRAQSYGNPRPPF